jgi:hypothetical protein
MENKQSGLANPWVQLALSVAFVTAYEVLLKFGAIETANIANSGWSWTGLSGLASLYVWLAIPLVVLSLITWLHVLRHIALSIAFPISQVVHAFRSTGELDYFGRINQSLARMRDCTRLVRPGCCR